MAIDFPNAPATGDKFTAAGIEYTWNGYGWAAGGAAAVDDWVNVTGDTMTGNLTINTPGVASGLVIEKTTPTGYACIQGDYNKLPRWKLDLAGVDAESGGNSGSNFTLNRYNDAGGPLAAPLAINRATGNTTLSGDLTINKATPTLVLSDPAVANNAIGVQCVGGQAAMSLAKGGSGLRSFIAGLNGLLNRWVLFLGNETPESGGNAGSDFVLERYNDAGAVMDRPVSIDRATGQTTLSAPLTLRNAIGAPEIRLDSVPGSMGGITASINNSTRWNIQFPNNAPETGGNAGSNFLIYRMDDNGAAMTPPALEIERATGTTKFGSINTATPGVGNNTPGVVINPNGTVFASCNNYSAISMALGSEGNVAGIWCAGVIVGSIYVNANSTSYQTSSDARMKQDLQSFDAGPIIDATNVYDYQWIATGERAYGVIAQEAVEVYPAAINHDEVKDWWGVDYSKYVPLLLQELKALRARVAQLEAAPATTPTRK